MSSSSALMARVAAIKAANAPGVRAAARSASAGGVRGRSAAAAADEDEISFEDSDEGVSHRPASTRPATAAAASASHRAAAGRPPIPSPTASVGGSRRRVFDDSMSSVSMSEEDLAPSRPSTGGNTHPLARSAPAGRPGASSSASSRGGGGGGAWEQDMESEFGARARPSMHRDVDDDEEAEIDVSDDGPPPSTASSRMASSMPLRSTSASKPAMPDPVTEEVSFDEDENAQPRFQAQQRAAAAAAAARKPSPPQQHDDDEVEVDFEDDDDAPAPARKPAAAVPVRAVAPPVQRRPTVDPDQEVEVSFEDLSPAAAPVRQQHHQPSQNQTPLPMRKLALPPVAGVRPAAPQHQAMAVQEIEDEEEIGEEEHIQSPRTKARQALQLQQQQQQQQAAAAAAAAAARSHLLSVPASHGLEDSYSDEFATSESLAHSARAMGAAAPAAGAGSGPHTNRSDYYEDDHTPEIDAEPQQPQQYSKQPHPPTTQKPGYQIHVQDPAGQQQQQKSAVAAAAAAPRDSRDHRHRSRSGRSRSRSRSRDRGHRAHASTKHRRAPSTSSYSSYDTYSESGASRHSHRSRSRSGSRSPRRHSKKAKHQASSSSAAPSQPSSARHHHRGSASSSSKRVRTIEMATQTDPLSLADLLGPNGSSLLLASAQPPYVLHPSGYAAPRQFPLSSGAVGGVSSTGVPGSMLEPGTMHYHSAAAGVAARFPYPPPLPSQAYYPSAAPYAATPSAYDYPSASDPAAAAAAASSSSSSYPHVHPPSSVAPASLSHHHLSSVHGGAASSQSQPQSQSQGPSSSPSRSPSAKQSTAVFKAQIANILSTLQTCRSSLQDPSAPGQAYPPHVLPYPASAWGAELAYPIGAVPPAVAAQGQPLDYNSALMQARAASARS